MMSRDHFSPTTSTPRTRLGSPRESTGRLDVGGADLQASTGELSIDAASN